MHRLSDLTFDNSYARLPEVFFRRMAPQPLAEPQLVSLNRALAAELELDWQQVDTEELTAICAGKQLWESAEPLAMVYSGHQFGGYTPRLGDGRGLLLGELLSKKGQRLDLHLKGAGPTPFARGADGRAVLRSSIREYLIGEALHHLHIPTTRALCLVTSNTPVRRERIEPGAALIRVARSHIRFGHFEYFCYTGQHDALQQLADYVIARNFAELGLSKLRYERFFAQVVERTAELVAHWQAYGFAHGVMNTDNMSIIGDSFDFGPYAFMDDFEPDLICNHSDHTGRYAFNRQPQIAHWNCACLGEALLPLFGGNRTPIQSALERFPEQFYTAYHRLLRQRFGLERSEADDPGLFELCFALLHRNRVDLTLFFRRLCDFSVQGENRPLRDLFIDPDDFNLFAHHYRARLALEPLTAFERCHRMRQVNPKYILRNYLAQGAIEQAEAGDFAEVNRLLELLRRPFDEQPDYERYAALPPEAGKHLPISCSS